MLRVHSRQADLVNSLKLVELSWRGRGPSGEKDCEYQDELPERKRNMLRF